MHRFLILSIISFIFVPGLISAQSEIKVSGVITDESTGEPVKDAAVTLLPVGVGTYTDMGGHYALSDIPTGWYTLQIDHVGYHAVIKTLNVSRGGNTHSFLSLKPKVFWNDSTLMVEEQSADADIHLTYDEIQQSQAESISELLRMIPQVQVSPQGGSGGSSVTIRGSHANQVLVLLDGIPLNNPLTGEADLGEISTNRIESVEIRTRGSSAEYGPGAFAGVVDIQTTDRARPGMKTTLAAGSYGYRRLDASLNGNIQQWSYTMGGSRRLEENDYPFKYTMTGKMPVTATRKNAVFRTTNMNAGVQKIGANDLLRFRGLYINSQRGLPGRIFQLSPYATANTDRYQISGTYQWSSNSDMVSVTSQYGKSVNMYTNQYPEKAPLQYTQVPEYHSEYEHDQYHGKIKYRRILSDYFISNIILSGTSGGFRQAEIANIHAAPIRANQKNIGLSTGIDWKHPVVGDGIVIQFTPVIRQDFVHVVNQEIQSAYPFFSYVFRGEIKFLDFFNSTFYAISTRNFRPPTYGDLYYQHFRATGNPYLRPEKSHGYYMGLNTTISGPLFFQLNSELFWKDVTDQIIWLTGSFGNFSPTNTNSHITGQTFTASWSINQEKIFGTFHFEHLLPLDKTDEHTVYNKLLPFRPRFRWQGTFGIHHGLFRIEYFHRFYGRRYSTRSNTKHLSPFDVGDLNISLTPSMPEFLSSLHAEIGLRVENTWDTPYEIMHRMPEPGRQWIGSLKIRFNP